jgi:hypothetical protein
MMEITAIPWAEISEGSFILCPDGVQREIGEESPAVQSGEVRRRLGDKIVGKQHDTLVLVIEQTSEVDAMVVFLRAGFKVEVITYG